MNYSFLPVLRLLLKFRLCYEGDQNKSLWDQIILGLIIINMDQGLISTKLRSVITLVDKLRDINLESYIKLPKIVAVGSQSSGKSSLVEQIVGLDFLPRGSGVVTRRPLQIRMVYQKDLKQPYAQFAQIPEKMTNFTKVKQSIQLLTDKICGKRKNIIDKPIILDVYSANCPNLTIIDLPGLTRIPIDGQDENILEVTTKMIKKYMQQPSTIILCVIPANQDITNDEVLHFARKIDQQGQRTIGCITKIDIMDRGTDARNLLMNKGEVPLILGYVGIKNRSQADINEKKTVQQAIEDEKMYFSKSPIYSSLPLECLGTTSLVNKLTKVLTQNICRFLPQLISKIKQRKAQLSTIVKSYGRPLPKNDKQKQSLLWQMCSQFIGEYKKCLVGQISVLKCQQKLLKTSTHIQTEMLQCLDEQFNLKIEEMLADAKIEFAIRKFQGSNMPGFPSISAFLFLLHPLLHSLKTPIELTLNNIFDGLMHIVQLIVSEIAHEYAQFRQYIIEKVNGILNRYRKSSRQFIESMMECESGYIYTNNPTYNEFMEQKKQDNKPKTMNKNPMVDILRKRINAYYRVIVKNLRDLAPKNIKYFLIVEATKTLEFQIFQIINQSTKIDQFLKIGQSSKSQRLRNQQEYDTLCKAEQFVLTHSGLTAYRDVQNRKRVIFRQQQIEQANKKRKEKETQKIENKKLNEQTSAKKQQPKKEQKKAVNQGNDSNKKNEPSPGKNKSLFDNFFGKKTQPPKQIPKQIPKSNPTTAANTTNNSPKNSNNPQKKPMFDDMFGLGEKKTTQPPVQPQTSKTGAGFTETYNKEVGKATDKAVDEMYANKQFQQKSKQAVAEGTSLAAQKQLGVSEQTGKVFGKGAAWLFGQDATQNYLKQQTKKNIKDQTQIK